MWMIGNRLQLTHPRLQRDDMDMPFYRRHIVSSEAFGSKARLVCVAQTFHTASHACRRPPAACGEELRLSSKGGLPCRV